MPYKIHKIIPYNLVGAFQMEDRHYKFHFMNSTGSNVGNLYVYGAGEDGKIKENVFLIPNLLNRNFEPVYSKIKEFFKVRINNDVWEIPSLIYNELQYQILISGTNQNGISSDDNMRNISVYFFPNRKVVLNSGKSIIIHEDNINHFLKEIDNYDL